MKIKHILARLTKPVAHDEAREIETMLAQLDADVAAARATLAGLAEKRIAALKADDDAALDGIDAGKLAADRLIEKASLARPQIETRLAAARKAAHDASRAAYNVRRRDVADRLKAALNQVVKLNVEAAELDTEVRTSLGDEFRFATVVYRYVSEELVDDWHKGVRESFGEIEHRPSPPPVVAAKPAKKEPKQEPKPKPPKPKRILPDIPAEDHVRVTAIRKGYETPQGFPLDVGDEVDLPWQMAQKAVESGAVEYSGELVAA